MIRVLARIFPNSYHLGFFACCREVHDPFRHTGCVGGSYDEAVAQFKALDQEQMPKNNTNDDNKHQGADDLNANFRGTMIEGSEYLPPSNR